MYPNTQYYVPNNQFAPTNFYDIAPRIDFAPTDTVRVEYYFSFLWRYSERDAIYIGAPWPGGQGQNAYAVTALVPGRAIGRQSDLRVDLDDYAAPPDPGGVRCVLPWLGAAGGRGENDDVP